MNLQRKKKTRHRFDQVSTSEMEQKEGDDGLLFAKHVKEAPLPTLAALLHTAPVAQLIEASSSGNKAGLVQQ